MTDYKIDNVYLNDIVCVVFWRPMCYPADVTKCEELIV